jgi:adenosylcobyric acid synthase
MTASPFVLALVAYPQASDLDEFAPLAQVAGVALVRATRRAQLENADCVVLPSSSDVGADLAWLRREGLDSAIALHAQARRPVLGVGGGMQLLGEGLVDPNAIAGNAPGLGLLPIVSLIEPAAPATATLLCFDAVIGHWSPLSGLRVPALELHQGRSVQHQGMGAGRVVVAGGLGWQNVEGNVLGVFARGLFGQAAVVRALFGPS